MKDKGSKKEQIIFIVAAVVFLILAVIGFILKKTNPALFSLGLVVAFIAAFFVQRNLDIFLKKTRRNR